jgi:hypothetical protein
VCSAGPGRLWGLLSTSSSFGDAGFETGEEMGVGLSSSCDRFTLLGGGGNSSALGVDLELER